MSRSFRRISHWSKIEAEDFGVGNHYVPAVSFREQQEESVGSSNVSEV